MPEETTYWLTIDKHDEDVKLRAEANNTERARSVKLYARSGEKAKEIVVAQSGRLKYILAINPGNPMSVHKMMDFELSKLPGSLSQLRHARDVHVRNGISNLQAH